MQNRTISAIRLAVEFEPVLDEALARRFAEAMVSGRAVAGKREDQLHDIEDWLSTSPEDDDFKRFVTGVAGGMKAAQPWPQPPFTVIASPEKCPRRIDATAKIEMPSSVVARVLGGSFEPFADNPQFAGLTVQLASGAWVTLVQNLERHARGPLLMSDGDDQAVLAEFASATGLPSGSMVLCSVSKSACDELGLS